MSRRMMKRSAGAVGRRVALLSVGLFALLGGGTLSAQPVSGEVPANVVAISASGQLEVPQDWLTMTLTTSREGSDAAAVQSQLRQAVDAALAIAKPAVVREQMEVRTGSFGVYPRRGNNGRITGWQGSAELVLEGRDFVVISRTAGKVTSLNVGHVAFSLSPAARQKLESEAQALAIERFKARANEVAKAFGFGGYTLREVSIQAADQGDRPVFARAMADMPQAAMVPDAALPVEAGKTQVIFTASGSIQLR
jgi:predicted secreted protein